MVTHAATKIVLPIAIAIKECFAMLDVVSGCQYDAKEQNASLKNQNPHLQNVMPEKRTTRFRQMLGQFRNVLKEHVA
jgi:hypothetical protein